MEIQKVWLDVNLAGNIWMYATTGAIKDAILKIYPANAPSAIRFWKAFQAGEPLSDKDVLQVKTAAMFEVPIGRWKIVDMRIEPDDSGINVLKATFRSGDLEGSTNIWPPRAPSARLFLDSFRRGKELDDDDLALLLKFVNAEAFMVGLSRWNKPGVLDWRPEWEGYL